MSSSAHIATSKHGAVTHNSRENFSHSVVFIDEKNELWNNTKEAYSIYRKELAIRSKAYSDRTKQKLQKKTSTKLSVVINLEKHHTLKDLKSVKKYLENSLDTIVYQMAIHRDEGKLVSTEDGTELYSGKDFFKNPENDKLYYDKKYTKEIDMSKYDIQKNYHAHIEMLGIDSTGAAIRHNKMHKHFLTELQDITAQTLGMERTYGNKKRLDTHQFKEVGQAEQQQKRATQALLKKEIAKLREQLKEAGATRKSYAKLEQKNRELKEKIKKKDLTIEQLKVEVKNLDDENDELDKENDELYEKVEKVENQLISARETISKLKTSNDTLKEELRAYRQNIDVLRAQNQELVAKLNEFEQEQEILKQKLKVRNNDRQLHRKALNEANAEIKKLKQELVDAELLIAERSDKEFELNSEVEHLEHQIYLFKQENRELRQENMQLKSEKETKEYKSTSKEKKNVSGSNIEQVNAKLDDLLERIEKEKKDEDLDIGMKM